MKRIYFFIAVLVAVGAMTSCSSSDETEEHSNANPALVHLNLSTQSTTRASLALPADNGATISQNEGTITNYTVGLFDLSNNVVMNGSSPCLQDFVYGSGGGKTTTPSITTTTLARKICVAANTTAGGLFTGTSASTITNFKNISIDLGYTTSADGTSNADVSKTNFQKQTGLPMFVETDNQLNGFATSTTATPTVALERLVARVSLSSLKTSFLTGSTYAGCKFVPTEIFMYNVNDKSTFGGTSSSTVTTELTSLSKGYCEMTKADGTDSTLTNYAYLSSGSLYTGMSAVTITTGAATYLPCTAYAAPFSFYVFPHNATNATKLVIKGLFTDAANVTSVVYYPIVINHGQTNTKITDSSNATTTTDTALPVGVDSYLFPNCTYDLSVTIKAKGSTSPSQSILASTANVTMTVSAWKGYTQDVTVQ